MVLAASILLLGACAGPRLEVVDSEGERLALQEPASAEAPAGERGREDAATAAGGDARVWLPAGACETGRLEVQIFDRGRDAWVPHPSRPFVAAGSCVEERAERLLSDFRVRCVDPEGGRAPSAWVQGVRVDEPVQRSACANR